MREIKEIDKKETYDFILNKHYAKRKPSISLAYGLYIDNELVAILTIGKPASNSLCIGICGKEHSHKVFELNRLCASKDLPKNSLSYFVGGVLKKLRKEDIIIVSYADTGMNHAGYIYQATNWLYTGATKERTDKYVDNGKHSRHYTDEHKHLRVVRTSKHRYVYFTKRKNNYTLNYEIKPYPKSENKRYTLGEGQKRTVLNKITGEIIKE